MKLWDIAWTKLMEKEGLEWLLYFRYVDDNRTFLGKPSKKKNCDYSDNVPISFYTHPPEGDRDSNFRDKINVISKPPLPPVVGTFKLKNIRLKYAKF